jgi:LacI family transcriptional regulator, galactose operon repressor
MARPVKNNPTIVDIARKLGISAMTVSRALNGKGEVSKEMRRKVVECADRLGYRPHRWARSLVTQRSLMVGVVVPEIAHSFFAEIISGIEDVLEKSGYDILLCHSRSDPARERAEIHALIESRIDGLIVAPEQPEKSPEPFVDLQKHGIPFVLVDRFFPGREFSCVRLDDLEAGFLATKFLIEQGHRKIAHIAGPDLSTGSLRRRGFLKALRAFGLDQNKKHIVQARFGIDEGREAMRELLKAEPRPTAVFAGNDPQAIGAIYACREAGLRVPEDISIIGAGNIEGVYHPNPFLTTIDWPRQELGSVAAEILLHAIGEGKESQAVERVFPPQLLVRHSTAPAATKAVSATSLLTQEVS